MQDLKTFKIDKELHELCINKWKQKKKKKNK